MNQLAYAVYLKARKADHDKMIETLRNAVVDTSFAMKPGCKILPMTPTNRPSRLVELVAWCNNMAASLGNHDDPSDEHHNPKRPGYHCTKENFGVMPVKAFAAAV